jgi:hypothetical protein
MLIALKKAVKNGSLSAQSAARIFSNSNVLFLTSIETSFGIVDSTLIAVIALSLITLELG